MLNRIEGRMRRLCLDVWDAAHMSNDGTVCLDDMRRIWGARGARSSLVRRWERWKAELKQCEAPVDFEREASLSSANERVLVRLRREAREWAGAWLDAHPSGGVR